MSIYRFDAFKVRALEYANGNRLRGIATAHVQPPSLLPVFTDVMIDKQNRLWIQEYENPERWLGIDSEGMTVGQFLVPVPGGRLLSIDREELSLLYSDRQNRRVIGYFPLTFAKR